MARTFRKLPGWTKTSLSRDLNDKMSKSSHLTVKKALETDNFNRSDYERSASIKDRNQKIKEHKDFSNT